MSGMIRVCFFYLLMWMSGTIWGQATRMYVPSLSFTKRDGLTQNQVVNLVEDNLGRVWIGTQNGISVFDGSRVKSFHPDQLRLDGAVKYLNVDGEGRLWGATNSHLFSFDGIRTQVVELTSPYGSGVTFYLSPDGEPALAAQEGDQVLRNGRLIPLTDAYPWLQCTGPVRELRQFGRNDLCFYLVGRDSLQIYDSGRKLLGNVSLRENGCHYEPVVQSFDAYEVESVFRCAQHADQLYHYDISKPGFQPVNRPLFEYYLNTDPANWRISLDGDYKTLDALKSLFVQSGLTSFSLEREVDQSEVLVARNDVFNTVPIQRPFFCRTQLLDRSGQRLFTGSDEGLKLFFLNGWMKIDLPSCGNPWSVLPSRVPGRFWLTCHKDGFIEIDREGNVTNRRSLPDDLPFSTDRQLFPGNCITSQGGLYAGGYRGVYRLTDRGIDHWRLHETIEALMSDPKSGGMLAAGSHIFLLPSDPRQPIRDTIFVPRDISTGISCTDLLVASGGDTIWISGWGGIGRYIRRTGQWTIFTFENGRFPFQGGFSLERSADQRIWCGGTNGLSVWDPVSDRFVPVLKDAIIGQVSQVMAPAADTLLVIGANALSVLNIRRTPVRLTHRFDEHSGYTVLEPNENGAYLDREGQLWIPSIDGIHRFDYAHLADLGMLEHVLLIDQINGQPVPLTRQRVLRDTLRKAILELHTWLIGPEGGRAILEYQVDQGPWKSSPYADRLVLDDLDHGHRTLRIRAHIPGVEPQHWSVLNGDLWVILPIWKRKSIQAGLLALALFLLIVAVIGLVDRIRSQRQLSAVNQQLQETRLRTIQAQLNPHFLFNAMTTLQNTIQNRSREEASEQLVQLSRLIRQVLELSVQQTQGKASLPLTSLSRELELLNDYVKLEQSQRSPGFTFILEVDEDLQEDDPMVPPLMIQPVVENAIQHGLGPLDRAGHVWVRLSEENHRLHYQIEDDGIGREAAARRVKETVFRHRSHGVDLLRERVNLLNDLGYPCQLEVRDRPGGGTIVDIYMTLPS
ncbi:MAG: histidine kinase [Chitinophagales bacterium]|nr:histidine kinase [Chitinophagales bacterium]